MREELEAAPDGGSHGGPRGGDAAELGSCRDAECEQAKEAVAEAAGRGGGRQGEGALPTVWFQPIVGVVEAV